MGNIGDPITPSVPVVGAAGPGFATDINAILTELVARLSAKVPLSSINANSTFNLAGSPITNAGYITLTDLLSAPGATPTNRLTAFGGNLFYVGPSGVCQITVGTQLNAAAIGGITGDYSSAGPMQFRYNTANTRYDSYANFGTNTWAYVRALGFDIAGGATSSVSARLAFGGLANLTFTLPATLPAANQILSVDNTGAITAGTTTALASGNSIQLSGAGVYKHGTKTIHKALLAGDARVTAGTLVNSGLIGTGVQMDVSTTANIKMPELPSFCRIINVTATFDTAGNRNGCTGQVFRSGAGDPAATGYTAVGGAMSNNGTARLQVTGLNALPGVGETYWVRIVSNGSVQPVVVNIYVDYDIP